MRRVIYMVIGMAALVAAMSFKAPPVANSLTISFSNYVGNQPLKLDSATYTNKLGQSYTISKFKYYIGNISLKKSDGTAIVLSKYYLINEEDSASKQIALTGIPQGNYSSISFIVGVDSIHNCSGAQDGALDPINAMFWEWNTGYIFLKMEGKSPLSKSPGHLLEFHIGGYKAPNNCIRTVTLSIKNGIAISQNKPVALHIKADESALFSSPTPVDFSVLSSVVDFHHATSIADNYSSMFSIVQ